MTSDKSHCCMQMLQCCSAACSIAFNIVAWTKLMTLTNESTYFEFQMIWGEFANLFLFHGVPGWYWCGPSGGDLRSQSSSQDQPPPHLALAELLITGHQSGGSEAQPGPSSLHLWSRSSLTVAWLETLQSPTCCPAPWLPHSAEARSKRKPINHLSSPVSSQVNTKQNLWINELYSDSGVKGGSVCDHS